MAPPSFCRIQSGLALAEVLVGIFVLGTLTVSIMSLATLGTRTAFVNELRTVAQSLANEEAEKVRAMPYLDIGYNDGQLPDGVIPPSKTVQRNYQTYTVLTTVTLIDDDKNGTLTEPKVETNADYKEVFIKVLPPATASTQQDVQVGFFAVPHACNENNDCPHGAQCNLTTLFCDPPPPPPPSCPPGVVCTPPPPTCAPGVMCSSPPPSCAPGDPTCPTPSGSVAPTTSPTTSCAPGDPGCGSSPLPSGSVGPNPPSPLPTSCVGGTPGCVVPSPTVIPTPLSCGGVTNACQQTGCPDNYTCNTTSCGCEPNSCLNATYPDVGGNCPADYVGPCHPSTGQITITWENVPPNGTSCGNYCQPHMSITTCDPPPNPDPWCDTDGDGNTNCGPPPSSDNIPNPQTNPPSSCANVIPADANGQPGRPTCCYSLDQGDTLPAVPGDQSCHHEGDICFNPVNPNASASCHLQYDTYGTGCPYYICRANPSPSPSSSPI